MEGNSGDGSVFLICSVGLYALDLMNRWISSDFYQVCMIDARDRWLQHVCGLNSEYHDMLSIVRDRGAADYEIMPMFGYNVVNRRRMGEYSKVYNFVHQKETGVPLPKCYWYTCAE